MKIASERDARIDWLRGAAALLVLFHHLFAPVDWTHPVLQKIDRGVDWFWLGVPVFFVLSGRCVGAAWLRSESAVDFALRRFKRIYPPYFASLAVVMAAVAIRWYFVGVNDVTPLPHAPGAVLATLTLATAPATSVPTINWVYWSLTYEVAYYLVCAVLLLMPTTRARLAAWLFAHAAFVCLDLANPDRNATAAFFVNHWSLFAAGFALALYKTHRTPAIATLAICAAHMIAAAWLRGFPVVHFVGLATILALLLPSRRWTPRPDQIMPKLGVVSYGLYLTHVPIGVFLIQQPVRLLLGDGLLPELSALCAAVGGSLLFAWLFHRHIETRCLNPSRSP